MYKKENTKWQKVTKIKNYSGGDTVKLKFGNLNEIVIKSDYFNVNFITYY